MAVTRSKGQIKPKPFILHSVWRKNSSLPWLITQSCMMPAATSTETGIKRTELGGTEVRRSGNLVSSFVLLFNFQTDPMKPRKS